jgi:hypothetical protein
MKSGLAVFLALGCLGLVESSVLAQPRGPRGGGQQAARYGWLFSLEDGKAQARKSGKPLMVVVRCEP